MQTTVTRTDISAQAGLAMVQAAVSYAESQRWDITAAVVDARGDLVAFLRTDEVIAPAVGFAIDKAYTAATLRKSSEGFGDRMASKPTLSLGVGTRDRLITWAGGLPIFSNGTCIGGIGVSGAQDHEDLACAAAALNAVGLSAEA